MGAPLPQAKAALQNLATPQLRTVSLGLSLHFAGVSLHGTRLSPMPLSVPRQPAVIREVKIVSICFCNAQLAMGAMVIPTNEIKSVIKIVSIHKPSSGFGFIILPCLVGSLGIPIGGGQTTPRNNTKKTFSRRPGVCNVGRFPVDESHCHIHRRAPFFFRLACRFQPTALFVKDATKVIRVSWWLVSATEQCHQQAPQDQATRYSGAPATQTCISRPQRHAL